jgi:hypothetical protein
VALPTNGWTSPSSPTLAIGCSIATSSSISRAG